MSMMTKILKVISLVMMIMVIVSIMSMMAKIVVMISLTSIMRKIEEHLLRHHCSIIEKFSTVQEGNIKNEEKQNE